MSEREPSRTALLVAAAVALIALIAVVTITVVVTRRVERLTTDTDQRFEPVREDLRTVNYELSREVAALTRYSITGAAAHLAEYRASTTAEVAAMRELAAQLAALDPALAMHYGALQREIRQWRATVEPALRGDGAAPRSVAYQTTYPEVIEALHRFDAEITRVQSSQRAALRRQTRLAVSLSGALVLVAAIAGLTVLRMARQLRATATALARESDERLAALDREREFRERAESLVRSRDEILGVVSHDLRSPLTAIALSTQMIEAAPEEREEHVQTILTSTRRMQRLIQDLLDVTKIENSSLSMRRETLSLERVADEVMAGQRSIAAEKGIELLATIDRPLPALTGDHDRLVQALTNLVQNALKFTPEGGSVQLTARARAEGVCFEVCDTGAGIAESDLPHLFEPFFQSKNTAHLGAGLGLRIVRAIVEAHGGTIQVSNRATGGACFAIDLPAS